MIPKTVKFKEIRNWDNLTLADFDTLFKLNHIIFHKRPGICCASRYPQWVANINNTPQLKEYFRMEYDRVINIHTKYTIKFSGIKCIKNVGFVNSTFVTEEQIELLLSLYNNEYVELNEEFELKSEQKNDELLNLFTNLTQKNEVKKANNSRKNKKRK